MPREHYRVGMPAAGRWVAAVNTDAEAFGGSGMQQGPDVLEAEEVAWHDQPTSLELTLPPLAAVWLVPEAQAPGR